MGGCLVGHVRRRLPCLRRPAHVAVPLGRARGLPMSAEKIRELNDAFRTTMTGGRVMLTVGVDALPSDTKAMVIRKVATFSDFSAENDPNGEHDFGSFELEGRKLFWKVDYYDSTMTFGS